MHAFHVRRHEKISLTPERTFAAYHGLIPDPQGSSRRGCKPENVAAKPTLSPSLPPRHLSTFSSSVTVASVGSVRYDTCCESRPTSGLSRRHSFDTVKACARGWTGSKNETEEDALGREASKGGGRGRGRGMLVVASHPTTLPSRLAPEARERPPVKGSHKIARVTFLLYHPAVLPPTHCRYIRRASYTLHFATVCASCFFQVPGQTRIRATPYCTPLPLTTASRVMRLFLFPSCSRLYSRSSLFR